jgi:hypothetical protein
VHVENFITLTMNNVSSTFENCFSARLRGVFELFSTEAPVFDGIEAYMKYLPSPRLSVLTQMPVNSIRHDL